MSATCLLGVSAANSARGPSSGLNSLRKKDLQSLCASRGLAQSGNKCDLVRRLALQAGEYGDLTNKGQIQDPHNINFTSRDKRDDRMSPSLLEGPRVRSTARAVPADVDGITGQMGSLHLKNTKSDVGIVGIVYRLPNAGGTGGYVGQTTRELAVRLGEHEQKHKRDISAAEILYMGARLNEVEAYFIGLYNSRLKGANKNTGKSPDDYKRGQRDGGWA